MTPSRRSVVLAGPVGMLTTLLAGCTTPARRAPQLPVQIDPDVALRQAAAARERSLVAALDLALLTASSTPAGRVLAQLRLEHLSHLQALAVNAPASPATQSPATTPAPTTASAPASPAAQAQLRRAQAGRERAAATAHAAATRTASAPLAALLAQLAASEASHAAVL